MMESHKVTYARDPRTDRYVIRVVGRHATYFEGRKVLVTSNAGSSRIEYLEELLSWAIDEKEQDRLVAYYAFITRISDLDANVPFFDGGEDVID
jgi:hypothetical protein